MRHLTMSAARRATFAKMASTRFDAGEAKLQPIAHQAVLAYVGKCRARFDAHVHAGQLVAAAAPAPVKAVAAAKPAPKFTTEVANRWLQIIDKGLPEEDLTDWAPILDGVLMPAVADITDTVLASAMRSTPLVKPLTEWRNDWLAQRRQELVNVPDQVTSQFRTALQALAVKDGTSVDDARLVAQEMLDDGYPSWSNRADLIARTEVVGANNQGSLASWTALADDAQMTATKSWLATEDSKTRDDHAAVDGMTVGIKDTFTVGDVEMNGPGDNAGGAGQVCNCRCTMTFDFPDDAQSQDAGDDSGGDEGENFSTTLADLNVPTVSSSLTAAATTAANTGVAIMLLVADTDAARLAAPGVEIDPPGLHCTLAYLAEPAASYTPEQQQSLISALGSVTRQLSAVAFATAQFNPNDPEREPCAVLLVQSPELKKAHDDVANALATAMLDQSTSFPIWIPHVAIGYNIDTSVIPAAALGDVAFDGLVLGWAGQQIPIGGDLDPAVQTDGQLTAAVEAPVSAPAATAPPAPPAAPGAPAPSPGATGGDTQVIDVTPGAFTWSGPLARLSSPGAMLPTSDGRAITAGGGTIRPLPLPLSWQEKSTYDHEGSVIVGRVLTVEDRGDVLWGTGDWLDPMMNMSSGQAMAQVDAGLGMISIDMGMSSVDLVDADGQPVDGAVYNGDGEDLIANYVTWEFCGATLVSVQAYSDTRITNDEPDESSEVPMETPIAIGDGTFAAANPEPPTVSADGTSVTLNDGTVVNIGDSVGYTDPNGGGQLVGTLATIDADASTVTITPAPADDGTPAPIITVGVDKLAPAAAPNPAKSADPAASLTASSALQPYKAASFEKREFTEVTPFSYDPDTGQVWGHAAQFEDCHLGKLQEGVCTTAPRTETDYGMFHLGGVYTDDGMVDVGKVTVGTGHAPPGSYAFAMQHYDNTGTAVAVVRAYEDDFGIQLAGEVIHGTPPERIEEMLRSPISGDWRNVGGNLELTAALCVNTPGFAVKRKPHPRFGMDGQKRQVSLVAAGVVWREDEEITLPSGIKVKSADMDSLVAAVDLSRERQVRRPTAAQLAEQDEAKMRLAFAGGRRF